MKTRYLVGIIVLLFMISSVSVVFGGPQCTGPNPEDSEYTNIVGDTDNCGCGVSKKIGDKKTCSATIESKVYNTEQKCIRRTQEGITPIICSWTSCVVKECDQNNKIEDDPNCADGKKKCKFLPDTSKDPPVTHKYWSCNVDTPPNGECNVGDKRPCDITVAGKKFEGGGNNFCEPHKDGSRWSNICKVNIEGIGGCQVIKKENIKTYSEGFDACFDEKCYFIGCTISESGSKCGYGSRGEGWIYFQDLPHRVSKKSDNKEGCGFGDATENKCNAPYSCISSADCLAASGQTQADIKQDTSDCTESGKICCNSASVSDNSRCSTEKPGWKCLDSRLINSKKKNCISGRSCNGNYCCPGTGGDVLCCNPEAVIEEEEEEEEAPDVPPTDECGGCEGDKICKKISETESRCELPSPTEDGEGVFAFCEPNEITTQDSFSCTVNGLPQEEDLKDITGEFSSVQVEKSLSDNVINFKIKQKPETEKIITLKKITTTKGSYDMNSQVTVKPIEVKKGTLIIKVKGENIAGQFTLAVKKDGTGKVVQVDQEITLPAVTHTVKIMPKTGYRTEDGNKEKRVDIVADQKKTVEFSLMKRFTEGDECKSTFDNACVGDKLCDCVTNFFSPNTWGQCSDCKNGKTCVTIVDGVDAMCAYPSCQKAINDIGEDGNKAECTTDKNKCLKQDKMVLAAKVSDCTLGYCCVTKGEDCKVNLNTEELQVQGHEFEIELEDKNQIIPVGESKDVKIKATTGSGKDKKTFTITRKVPCS